MTQEARICESGLWIDSATDRIVTSPPVEGKLLLAPGAEILPAIEQRATNYGGLPADVVAEPAVLETATVTEDDVETGTEDLTVTTKTTRKGRA